MGQSFGGALKHAGARVEAEGEARRRDGSGSVTNWLTIAASN
jgi:hypothetical protein